MILRQCAATDETLKKIAHELNENRRKKISVGWSAWEVMIPIPINSTVTGATVGAAVGAYKSIGKK